MNYYQILLHVSFVYLGVIVVISSGWIFPNILNPDFEKQIEKNIDGSINVTCDCKGRKVWVFILEDGWPHNMNSLVIKNSVELHLIPLINIYFTTGDHLRTFKHLKFVNISRIINELPTHVLTCLPSNLIFENVGHIENFHLPRFSKDCEKWDLTLKSLVFKNVTMDILRENGMNRHNLRKVEMEDVYIDVAISNFLKLLNRNGVVKITRSYIHNLQHDFMKLNVSEVIFSENEIINFNERHRIFSLEADKVIFNGNRINTLTNETMEIVSDDVTVTENIIDQMDEAFFDSMKSKSVINSSMDFSRNIIPHLWPKSLESERNGNASFANFTITGNMVGCNCPNLWWFEMLIWDRISRNFDSIWTNETNRNKCWELPNCYLHQVLHNYHDLCESDYNCLAEDKKGKSTFNSTNLNNESKMDNDTFNLNWNNLDNESYNLDNGKKMDNNSTAFNGNDLDNSSPNDNISKLDNGSYNMDNENKLDTNSIDVNEKKLDNSSSNANGSKLDNDNYNIDNWKKLDEVSYNMENANKLENVNNNLNNGNNLKVIIITSVLLILTFIGCIGALIYVRYIRTGKRNLKRFPSLNCNDERPIISDMDLNETL